MLFMSETHTHTHTHKTYNAIVAVYYYQKKSYFENKQKKNQIIFIFQYKVVIKYLACV